MRLSCPDAGGVYCSSGRWDLAGMSMVAVYADMRL